MKRKKPKTQKPAWQVMPMATIVTLVSGWEWLKYGRNEIKNRPDALAHLVADIAAKQGEEKRLTELLDSIASEPQASFRLPQLVDQMRRFVDKADGEEVPLAIITFWEIHLAHIEQGSDAHSLWLSGLNSEERLLITRLQKRISIPKA